MLFNYLRLQDIGLQKILVSSCLLGNKVRYDGESQNLVHPQLSTWQQEGRFVSICPEVTGGLPIPRARAEQIGNQVIDEYGNNVTRPFNIGAKQALELCHRHKIKFALLKEFSPSCGSTSVYNGQFKGIKVPGMGTTAKRLTDNGIHVFNEFSIDALITAVEELT